MDKRLEKLEEKLDKTNDLLREIAMQNLSIGKDVAKNTTDLAEHMRRTELLENRVEKLTYLVFIVFGAGLALGWPSISHLIKAFI
jgi:chromosome segregation ATPase